MFNTNHIISHNINIQCHMSLGHMHAQHMGGWLSPYDALTAYQTSWSCNKAIWARRTKIAQSPLPIHYENYKLLTNYFIHIWTVPRDSRLLLGGLDYAKLLFYEYLSTLVYKYIF